MPEEKCPVCLSHAERGRDKDYGERQQFNCPRCGPFAITGTALAMLRSRVENDPLGRARLSHAIRSNTSPTNWLLISSTNLDEFVRRPLPGVEEQLLNLVRWIAAKLRDDVLGRISLSSLGDLAAVVGTVDGERVGRLIAYGAEQGILNVDSAKSEIGLSVRGTAMTEPLNVGKKSETKVKEDDRTKLSPEICRANCNTCGGLRDAYIKASHTVHGSDGEVSWSETFDVLECPACHSISVRRKEWFSEWEHIETDPVTGQPRLAAGINETYWPAPTKRAKPNWIDSVDDDVLRGVMDEVYRALDAGLLVLASIGTRTLLDRAMFLRIGDPLGGFTGKLNAMFEKGHIGKDEKDILAAITDAGNAAAHRGFAPTAATFGTIIETVENFLQREFVLKSAAGEVRKATPPRK